MDQNGAKRYSAALFEAAKENNKLESFMEQMENLNSILVSNFEFMEILRNPSLQMNEKKNIVDRVFRDRIDDEIIRLLYILIDHGKINEFITVNLHYRDMVYNYNGIKTAYVTTAVQMDDEEKKELKTKLSKKYGCTIEIHNIVDPKIIGGVYLKIDDEITDATVRGNFQKMNNTLMNQ